MLSVEQTGLSRVEVVLPLTTLSSTLTLDVQRKEVGGDGPL